MPRIAAHRLIVALSLAIATGAAACATAYIGDTDIPDTEENRVIYERVMEYRQAVEERDGDKLRAMVSRDYYENANTTDRSEDDYGHDVLTSTVIGQLAENVLDVNVRILMRRIDIDGDRAFADYEYYYQFKYTEGGVTGWEQKNNFNRLEFVREDDTWEDHRGPLTWLVARVREALAAALVVAVAANLAHAAPEPAALAEARAALGDWRLDDAAKRLAGKAPKGWETAHATLLGRLDLQHSDYAAVTTRLAPLIQATPDAWEARVVLGRAMMATGEKRQAFAVLDALADAYLDERLKAPRDLVWLAVALQLNDYPKNANQIFEEALEAGGKADPELDDARVLWGDLFVSKYNYQDSDALYKEVLQRTPGHAGATVGVARIDIVSDRAFGDAREKLERVLAAAPQHVPAHNLLALIELEGERPDAAVARLMEHSLKVAPNDLEALALLGAARYVADDAKGWAAAEKRALAVSPRFAAFYTTVAEHAARIHRYKEAIALHERALALDGDHWPALAGLGMGHSRVGDDEAAMKYLQRAYEGDPFDVRTFNLLAHFYDDVQKHFEWLDAKPMRVRVHKDERSILERYVPPLLTEAWGALVKKYRFTPEAPLHVEIFPDQQTFAVRSTGLPQLSAHGICFGHVVTSRSPSDGNFNWAEVLWHELSHVFHIQLSKNRVPRWFTEGLAVYESTEARSSWAREMDPELLAYKRAGKLRTIGDFNLSFTRAKSLQDILVAYYHAYKVAAFIDARWGFAKMRRMLELWGERKDTAAVVRGALGVDLAELDRLFSAWLDEDLAYLTRGFNVPTEPFREDPAAFIARAEAAPDDVEAQANAAVAALVKGDEVALKTYVDRTLALASEHPRALFLLAGIEGRRGDKAAARATLTRLLALGHDGVEVRRQLAQVAEALGDAEAAVTHLEAALSFDPKDERAYYDLIRRLEALGRDADAYAWRARLAEVDQMNPKLPVALLEGAATRGAGKDDVLRWGELGLHIAPFEAKVHVAFARELKRLGLAGQARFEAESALILDPANAEAKALLTE